MDRGKSEVEYLNLINSTLDISKYPIFSNEGKSYLAKALAGNTCTKIQSLSASFPVNEWRYSTIELESTVVAEVLFCPSDGTGDQAFPPTLGENILLDSWLSGHSNTGENFSSLVLTRVHSSDLRDDTLSALYRTLNCHRISISTQLAPSFVSGKIKTKIKNNSRIARKQISYSRLLDRAFNELEARWRFLQVYKIFEQGYLDVILDNINSAFMQDPQNTLKAAQTSISSELEQLRTLVKSERLEPYFEFIWDDLLEIEKQRNKFAFKINAKASSGGSPEKYNRGAAAIYAIRCAIAHAGVRDIFYEQYPDADQAVSRILSAFEEAALLFVGIELLPPK